MFQLRCTSIGCEFVTLEFGGDPERSAPRVLQEHYRIAHPWVSNPYSMRGQIEARSWPVHAIWEPTTPDPKPAEAGGHEDRGASEGTAIPVGPALEVVNRHEATT